MMLATKESAAKLAITVMQETEPIENKYTSCLRNLLRRAGANLIGFADLKQLNMRITGEFPFGICFAIRYDDSAVDDLPNDNNWLEMSAQLGEKAKNIYDTAKEFINSQGYRWRTITSRIPSDDLPALSEELPQKTLATLSGLGWIGRSTLLITQEHGPRLRIGTLITDMPLSVDKPIIESSCGDCTACVDVCPVKAIKGASWASGSLRSSLLDVKRCNQYLWSTRQTLGRKQTCAICLKVCPKGKGNTK